MTEITITQFTASLSNGLTPVSVNIARVLQNRGGGNIEPWIVAQYLLTIPSNQLASLDYYREYIPPTTRTDGVICFVDLAFNVLSARPNNPPILAEWKFSGNINTLSVGFFEDQDKFAEILQTYPATLAKPYPFQVGVGPLDNPQNVGPGIQVTDLQNGVGLYTSTIATWQARALVQYTAYSNPPPDIPEQAVMADTLAASN